MVWELYATDRSCMGQLSMFYASGIKQLDTYIKIPMSILPGALEIRNLDGSLMVFICNSMPPSM